MGRFVAVVLMIFGIGLISMLTGTITTFFSKRVTKSEEPDTLENIISRLTDEERAELAEIAKIVHK